MYRKVFTMETVAERVKSSMDSLSPTGRRIARALLADYPSAGLGTTSSLASAANSSSASVIRFCAHLGFDSFVEMQELLRTELTTRSASPLVRAEAESVRGDSADEYLRIGADRATLITRTFQQNPKTEIDRLVHLLSKVSNRVVVVGGTTADSWADWHNCSCPRCDQVWNSSRTRWGAICTQ